MMLGSFGSRGVDESHMEDAFWVSFFVDLFGEFFFIERYFLGILNMGFLRAVW